MDIDDPGLQAFVQESQELFEIMETILLGLESNLDGEIADQINELFRAVHTIKGSAGLFGFDSVVTFSHQFESVMQRLRDNELSITDKLASLFLDSRDHLVLLVENELYKKDALDEDALIHGKALYLQLGHSLDSTDSRKQSVDIESQHGEVDNQTSLAEGNVVENENWHISLRFGHDVLRNGMDPLSFITYLSTVGDIVNITTIDDNLPPVDEMDPESCYLGFEIDLKSETDKETIENVFEFVKDDCEIHIIPPQSYISQYIKLINVLPEENIRIGEILTMCGALTQIELKEALQEQAIEKETSSIENVSQPLGELVVEQKAVARSVVDAALKKQESIKALKIQEQKIVRVDADKLQGLIDLVGELVIASANAELVAQRADDNNFISATERLSVLVEDIRDTTLALRMVKIGNTFKRFRRIVRETSRELGKEIELEIYGGDTELDKTLIEKITDPLMHLVRNSIDHGIERPEQRRNSGKSEKGTVPVGSPRI